MTCDPTTRLVVVHGTANRVLTSTLYFVGLDPILDTGQISVWAPSSWRPGSVVEPTDPWTEWALAGGRGYPPLAEREPDYPIDSHGVGSRGTGRCSRRKGGGR